MTIGPRLLGRQWCVKGGVLRGDVSGCVFECLYQDVY